MGTIIFWVIIILVLLFLLGVMFFPEQTADLFGVADWDDDF